MKCRIDVFSRYIPSLQITLNQIWEIGAQMQNCECSLVWCNIWKCEEFGLGPQGVGLTPLANLCWNPWKLATSYFVQIALLSPYSAAISLFVNGRRQFYPTLWALQHLWPVLSLYFGPWDPNNLLEPGTCVFHLYGRHHCEVSSGDRS